jgi:chromosome segregation ATPase
VNRVYADAATGEQIHEKEEFIESLTHDSIIIQIPYLKGRRRTELEQLLALFDQSGATDDPHFIHVNENDLPERYRPLLRRLQKALADPIVRQTMEAEDDLIEEFKDYQRLITAKEGIIAAKEKVIYEKEQTISEKEQTISEKEQTISEKEQTISEKEQTISEKEKTISEQEKTIEEKQRQLENAILALYNSGASPDHISTVLSLPIHEVKNVLRKGD